MPALVISGIRSVYVSVSLSMLGGSIMATPQKKLKSHPGGCILGVMGMLPGLRLGLAPVCVYERSEHGPIRRCEIDHRCNPYAGCRYGENEQPCGRKTIFACVGTGASYRAFFPASGRSIKEVIRLNAFSMSSLKVSWLRGLKDATLIALSRMSIFCSLVRLIDLSPFGLAPGSSANPGQRSGSGLSRNRRSGNGLPRSFRQVGVGRSPGMPGRL